MIIGIDIDDTISDTYEYIFAVAQKYTIEELGKNIETMDRKILTQSMYIETFLKWNEEEIEKFFEKYYEVIVKNVKPKIFAVETINKLKEEGHKIVLITARKLSNKFDIEALTKKWLKDNKINYDKLIVNAQDKAKIAQKEKIDIFIDDNILNCKNVVVTKIKTFIMDNITNVNDENDKVKRVYSWPHLYQEIQNSKEENR